MQNTVDDTTGSSPRTPLIATALAAFLDRRAAAGARPNTVAAYRRDIEGVLAHRPGGRGSDSPLDTASFVTAFAAWASRHRPSSVRRAWSAWNAFWDDLRGQGLCSDNPMAVIRRPRGQPEVTRRTGLPISAGRLKAVAASPDHKSRHPWPERDAALVGLLLGTGVRLGELTELTRDSLRGPAGHREIRIVDARGSARAVAIDPSAEGVFDLYLQSRARRFPAHDVHDPTAALLVDHAGRALARHQAQYLVRRLYERAGVMDAQRRGAATLALRHAYASEAADRGLSLAELQEALGDRSKATARRHLQAARLFMPPLDVRARVLEERAQRVAAQREEVALRMELLAARLRGYRPATPD
jgi:integrase/recombinase XerD